MVELLEHQEAVLPLLDNGKVLYGGVGSGKSITALAYYVERESPRDVVVITTARKRDSLDWVKEAALFGVGQNHDETLHGVITVDSWNNIGRYVERRDCFFIFDEQRVGGHGAWGKSFIKITKDGLNHWLLLSATPGDVWLDYAQVFIANGFYRNITDFKMQHVVYAPYVRFPKVDRYIGEQKLERLRNEVLVEMPFIRHTVRNLNYIDVGYDHSLMDRAVKDRWHPYEERPIAHSGELFWVMRQIVGSDPSRLETILLLMMLHPKLIIFYNFDYELEILRGLAAVTLVAEWNGHKHQSIPEDDRWIYLVQYVSGAQAWNCIETDSMVFYSLTYSYKDYEQAQGRIDRLNTPYDSLYYYILVSGANIDKAVLRALKEKRNFNERELKLPAG